VNWWFEVTGDRDGEKKPTPTPIRILVVDSPLSVLTFIILYQWILLVQKIMRSSNASNLPKKKSSSSAKQPRASKKQPPGVPHPQAGQALGPTTQRCECGGITGICGTAQGASKWRSHMRSNKHMDWDPLFN
jgi:hypothetical protein